MSPLQVLSATSLPEGAGGVFAVVELDGKRKKSAALIPAPLAEDGSQSFRIPVRGSLIRRGVVSIEGFVWMPRAGAG